jgi:hypothetical protein
MLLNIYQINTSYFLKNNRFDVLVLHFFILLGLGLWLEAESEMGTNMFSISIEMNKCKLNGFRVMIFGPFKSLIQYFSGTKQKGSLIYLCCDL